jgi:glycerophosphoryl diester phosphodiesterase
VPQLPIGFAHRGARSQAPDNTLRAFRLALALGASGLESDAWMTAEGVVILDHDGVVGPPWRRRPIAQVRRDALPPHIPALQDLYRECGTQFELSLDLKDPRTAAAIVETAAAADPGAVSRLWLCHPDPAVLGEFSVGLPAVRLVHSTSLRRLAVGAPEAEDPLALLGSVAAADHRCGVDAINLRADEWSESLVAAVHREGLLAFGWDAQRSSTLERLLSAGIDAVYCDHVPRMVDAVRRHGRAG